MNLDSKNYILDFVKAIVGGYTNREQAMGDPKNIACINFYFRPIAWSILKAPCLYSEQSYEHDKWSPYRQNIHKIYLINKTLIVENYKLKNKERIAGSGDKPELLNELERKYIIKNPGCSMHFKKLDFGHYLGRVEPGKKCLITHQGTTTYLDSRVELNNHEWISEEKGINNKTNKIVWGLENKKFIFKKIFSLNKEIDSEWLYGNKKD